MAAPGETLPWTLGLRNYEGLYVTVEPFGNRININSKVMKTKQVFTLVPQDGSESTVAIRTHLNKYLSAGADGSLACDAESIGEAEKFELKFHTDGRAFFVSDFGFILGGQGDHMDCYGRQVADDRLFSFNIAIHPQLNISNVNRKAFIHQKGDYFATDELIPWGDDAVITLNFRSESNRYTLQGADGRFLTASGKLIADPAVPDAQWQIQFVGKKVAFVANNGKYLTSIGGEGICKATKEGPPTPNELYLFEDSQPQIKMTSVTNGKKVSIASGNVAASQSKTTDTEQFQIEFGSDKKWGIRTSESKFWYIDGSGGVQGNGKDAKAPEARFDIEWQLDRIAIKAANGKYVEAKKSGALAAVATSAIPAATYIYEMTNRPRLVLRTMYGFVSTVAASGNLMCNKALPEVLSMHVRGGRCEIMSCNGKYWEPSADLAKVGATSDTPTKLYLEFAELSKFAIVFVTDSGERRYLKVNQSGTISAHGTEIEPATLFEF
eukprot:TRINITY_DN140_c0_g1_i1.p1 TRINITY_DN140_c0_g1~~TRINITY_DN140_c0_g1_i1.p1  ORF type:complete len:505 (+),score=135.42 TRINITY_DN140_c0_g1_i1:33-1517(+)